MKTKFQLSIMILVVLHSTIAAQEHAVDRKATIISGTASYMNGSANYLDQELFMYWNEKDLKRLIFTPKVSHFVSKNFFIGGGLEISSNKQTEYNSFAIGPHIGYAFGISNGSLFPYVDLGIRYYDMKQRLRDVDTYPVDKWSGSQIEFGFGAIVPIKKHIGLKFEGGYQFINVKNKKFDDWDETGKVFSIKIGIAGLIFKKTDITNSH